MGDAEGEALGLCDIEGESVGDKDGSNDKVGFIEGWPLGSLENGGCDVGDSVGDAVGDSVVGCTIMEIREYECKIE